MGGLLAAWVAEIGIVTYRGLKAGTPGPVKGLPLPSSYVSTFIVYGLLSLTGGTQAQTVGALVGWGFVVATLLNLWTPSHPGQLAPAKKGAPAK